QTNTARALALETVEHREQVAIQAGVLAFEDHVAVVNEHHRGRVLHRRLKYLMQLAVEARRAGDERAVDEEELPTQSMSECAADRRLAGARRPRQQDASLGVEGQL